MFLCVPEAWGENNIWLIRSASCADFGCYACVLEVCTAPEHELM